MATKTECTPRFRSLQALEGMCVVLMLGVWQRMSRGVAIPLRAGSWPQSANSNASCPAREFPVSAPHHQHQHQRQSPACRRPFPFNSKALVHTRRPRRPPHPLCPRSHSCALPQCRRHDPSPISSQQSKLNSTTNTGLACRAKTRTRRLTHTTLLEPCS